MSVMMTMTTSSIIPLRPSIHTIVCNFFIEIARNYGGFRIVTTCFKLEVLHFASISSSRRVMLSMA